MKILRNFRPQAALFLMVALSLGSVAFPSIDVGQKVQAQPCRRTYQQDKRRYQNRTGALALNNLSSKPVSITLYHPDSQRANGTWTIPPKNYSWVPAANYIISDDWGISYGGSQCIYYIGEITDYMRASNGGGFYNVYAEEESPEGFGLDSYIVLRARPRRR